MSQGDRDENFTYYNLEVVPQLWLLDRKLRSRTFQHITVPDILKEVFTGLDVDDQIQGTFEQREYCVQYRETDFAFASRLMEEEGHLLLLQTHCRRPPDGAGQHAAIPPGGTLSPTAIWEGGAHATAEEDRVFDWSKGQEIRSGKFTAWDHNFEMPDKHLEADKTIMDTVAVGHRDPQAKSRQQRQPGTLRLPGRLRQPLRRHQQIRRGPGGQTPDIFLQTTARTVEIRMQEEALSSLLIRGNGGHAGFTGGHTFDLTRHYSDNGKYVITSVQHDARQALAVDQVDGGLPVRQPFHLHPFGAALPAVARDAFAECARGADGGGGGPLRRRNLCR